MPETKIKIKVSTLVLLLAALFIVIVGGYFMTRYDLEICSEDYQWLNPSLNCGNEHVISKAGYIGLKTALTKKIENMKEADEVENVSVYFRDLENGPTFGIDEQKEFIPASLLKVPVMLAYLKLAEYDPTLLGEVLSYKDPGEFKNLTQSLASEKMIQPKTLYTVDELIFRMIAYSDNFAYGLLLEYFKKISPETDLITETYKELGMINPGDDSQTAILSVKIYASVFRLLYNAAYLNNEFSEKALGYLVNAEFGSGLRRGVPGEIIIAHKFGERALAEQRQLHDCGIIYYPDNPYLLCIMTRGKTFQELTEVIASISQQVFAEVDSRRLK